MANYQSAYTGAQIDAAVGAVQTAVAANGIVNTNGLNTILGSYLTSSSAASTYLSQSDASSIYLSKTDAANTYAPLTGTGTSGTWDISITGNAGTATLLQKIASTTTTAASTWSVVPSGSVKVWSQKFTDSSLTYTPSGGSATTITDSGDFVWWLTPSATANAATLCMRIDGTFQSSGFIGPLTGDITGSSTSLVSRGTISGSTHAAALKTYFDSNKSSEPRNRLITHYSSAYGNGSICMGYFLSGYDSSPYGGFFCCQYNSAKYAGIQNGTYTEYELTKSAASSKLIKENIIPMKDEEAQKILNITPVSFDYKKDFGEKNQFGFIAEELCDTFAYPVICKVKDLKDLENDPTSIQIDYIKFIPHLVKMIQIQQKEIDELREKVGQISKN